MDVTSRALPGRIVYLSAGRLFSMTLDGTPATELQIAGVFAPRDPMLSKTTVSAWRSTAPLPVG